MKYFLVACLFILLIIAAVKAKHMDSKVQEQGNGETTWIRNITIIDASPQSPRFNQDVLIQGENIVSVTPAGGKPPGQTAILDGQNKYLMPGFVDMHVHLLEHGRNEKGEIPPRVNWDWTSRSLRLLLAHGVTTVRDPGSETEAAVTLRNMLQEKKMIGPRLYTAGRILNASSFNPEPFQPVQTAEDVRKEIRWQAAAGVDFIKVYSSMPPELIKVAIEEAHSHNLRVIGHLQRTTWENGAELGIDFICHAAPWSKEYLPVKNKPVTSKPSMDAFTGSKMRIGKNCREWPELWRTKRWLLILR